MLFKKVLILATDLKFAELVGQQLEVDGYATIATDDDLEALRLAQKYQPDLIVIGTRLPGADRLAVCRRLRECSVPIALLVAPYTEQEEILDMEAEGEYYTINLCRPRKVASRIRIILRIIQNEELNQNTKEIRSGNLMVNFLEQVAYLNGKTVNLTPTEFKLLSILIRNPDQIFSRNQLEESVGVNFKGSDRTIDVHILNLRRKIEPEAHYSKYIQSVYGSGYRFVGGSQ